MRLLRVVHEAVSDQLMKGADLLAFAIRRRRQWVDSVWSARRQMARAPVFRSAMTSSTESLNDWRWEG
jgi:hypothetical protein